MAMTQMLVESRLIPSDDDQITVLEPSCQRGPAAPGSGAVSDDLPEHQTEEAPGQGRVVTAFLGKLGESKDFLAVGGRVEPNPLAPNGDTGIDGPYADRKVAREHEIGRASCRERVVI